MLINDSNTELTSKIEKKIRENFCKSMNKSLPQKFVENVRKRKEW